MISTDVCGTDSFLSLPHRLQALYYQLVLATDDDGVVSNPIAVARADGCTKKDILKLEASNLVIYFQSGVLAIVDWHNVNTLRKDRYKPTVHQKERKILGITTEGRYFNTEPWQPSDNQPSANSQPVVEIAQPQPNVTQLNVTQERELIRESETVNHESQPTSPNERKPTSVNLERLPAGTESIDEAATEALRKSCLAQIDNATSKVLPPESDAETAELKKAFRESTRQEQSTAPAEQPQPPPG